MRVSDDTTASRGRTGRLRGDGTSAVSLGAAVPITLAAHPNYHQNWLGLLAGPLGAIAAVPMPPRQLRLETR